MLPPDRIKPYLLHEDRFLRDAAAEYFGESWSPDPELAGMILQACDRYGLRDNLGSIRFLDHLVLTDQTLDQALVLLARADSDAIARHLSGAVAAAPIELVRAREQAVLGNPRLDEESARLLRFRLDVCTWPGEQLWQELQDFARRWAADQEESGDFDAAYADALIDALAPHAVPDTATLCSLLRQFKTDDVKPEEGWLDGFLVNLAGARRLREAVPAVVDKFHIDTDFLLEDCMEALGRIGDPEASRLIRQAFPSAPEHFCYWSADVPGRIKHQESEEALLALLETENDETIRTFLCRGLCKLFSERGVEPVRQVILAGDYDRFFLRLEDELLPVLDVLGITVPEAERWRKVRAEEHRKVQKRIAEFEEEISHPEPKLFPASPEPAGYIEPPRTMPFEHTEPRVGRNDPCPCGSGKKFKKCHGKK
jgi:SEC-C motif